MAIAEVQHKNVSSSASSTTAGVTVSATVIGNLIAVATGNQGSAGRTVITVIDNGGNTYTRASGAAVTDSGEPVGLDIWYCLVSTTIATLITASFSGAAGTFLKNVEAWEFSGLTTPVADTAGTVGVTSVSGTIDNGPLVTAGGSSGIGVAVGYSNNGVMTNNPATGNEYNAGGDNPSFFAFCSLIYAASGSHRPIWTDAGGVHNFAASTVLIKNNVAVALKMTPVIVRQALKRSTGY